jgi:hypothetical protein
MANHNNKRLNIKLNLPNSLWLSALARESAMDISVATLVNAGVEHAKDWLKANTPKKCKVCRP